jgi:hypothetical protein
LADSLWRSATPASKRNLRHLVAECKLTAVNGNTFVIGVDNTYAREWLEHRLKKVVVNVLKRIVEDEIEVVFVLVEQDGTYVLPSKPVVKDPPQTNPPSKPIIVEFTQPLLPASIPL